MANKKKISAWFWIFMVIFVIVLIVIYVASLGKINIGNASATEEFKDNNEQAKRRHDKLKELIEKKTDIKQKLARRFKRIYFAVRLFFVGIWGAYIFVLYKFNFIQNLEDVLNYSKAIILIWVALNFLTFGTLTNLNNFINLIKMKLENWIWGKHINIDEGIEINKAELANLKTK